MNTAFTPILDAIDESNKNLAYLFGHSHPQWFGLAVSDIALAIGDDEEILFTNTAITNGDSDSQHEVDIHVFTKDLLVHVHGVRSGTEDVRTTTVRHRRTLTHVGVAAGVSMNSRNPWPGRVELRLTYEDGTVCVLPGGSGDVHSPDQNLRIRAFLPSLRGDLIRH